jgi:hypothetical protein
MSNVTWEVKVLIYPKYTPSSKPGPLGTKVMQFTTGLTSDACAKAASGNARARIPAKRTPMDICLNMVFTAKPPFTID